MNIQSFLDNLIFSDKLKNKPSKESLNDLYERNKNIFFTEVKSIRYSEIKPELISGNNEYDENVNYKLKLANLVDSLSREVEVLKNNSSLAPTIPNIVSPSSSI